MISFSFASLTLNITDGDIAAQHTSAVAIVPSWPR
jgi:hypothetical protein